ncbi:MAG: hypothetical protein CVT98_04740 [Bacteroidetes bacterium HGW-Bacteroidetes-15]|nr:MAG: hypothetical protein CVT98_04740 [Bacteroidetes bacterium HGW-Bacteroidetes-15]
MKTLINTLILAILLAGSGSLRAQNWSEEYLGLPGDNLNLFAVMKLFQESETLEAFERGLNDPEKIINNLDLNGDNFVDYIMVYDYVEGDIHSIVLRVALNQRELQDVAVFTVEKLRNGAVQIQLIGDEALYGQNYIVEPAYAETPNPGYTGNSVHYQSDVVTTTYYEVASWPVIVYMYRPSYRVWHSAWYWGFYPAYWNPWNPYYWHYYSGYHYNWNDHYYAYYRPCRNHRSNHYHNVYYGRIRNTSPTVVVNINNRHYDNTYSRPDRRRDGELLFAERHPDRAKDLTRKREENVRQGRDGGRTDDQINTTGRRPVNEDKRTNPNTVTRPRVDSRQGRETNDKQEDAINSTRISRDSDVKNTRPPRREESAKPERPSTFPSREKTTTSPSRERPSTPATNVGRSSEREKPASTPKPSVSREKKETPVRENKSSTKSETKNERTERDRSRK